MSLEVVCTSELSEIEDHYISKGFRGNKLEKALASNGRYQKLLREKRKVVKKFWRVASQKQLKKYPLPTKQDFEILALANKLSRKKLSKQDAEIVELVLSQLEYDWRRCLQQKLWKIAERYGLKTLK